MTEILTAGLAELGVGADGGALSRFEEYYRLLSERGAVMNLTAISGKADTARLHFLDSAALLTLSDFTNVSVIDVGTGAGFPGLPMKICKPDIKLTLLDSLGKRVDFLSEVCEELKLEGTNCVHARAEDAGELRESFDFAVSRAVARLNMLMELCLPLVRVGGAFIAMKGADARAEAEEAENAAAELGGCIEKICEYKIPGTDIVHRAVVVRKERPTPERYPRRFARIQKKPL